MKLMRVNNTYEPYAVGIRSIEGNWFIAHCHCLFDGGKVFTFKDSVIYSMIEFKGHSKSGRELYTERLQSPTTA